MYISKLHIEEMINELETNIAESAISVHDASKQFEAATVALTEKKFEEYLKLMEESRSYTQYLQLQAYRRTMEKDLMKVDTQYVVTETKRLISPAGFGPDTHVFEQTLVAFHVDDLSTIPSSNVKLYAHDMRKVNEYV